MSKAICTSLCVASLLATGFGSLAVASDVKHIPCYAGPSFDAGESHVDTPSCTPRPRQVDEFEETGAMRDWCRQHKQHEGTIPFNSSSSADQGPLSASVTN